MDCNVCKDAGVFEVIDKDENGEVIFNFIIDKKTKAVISKEIAKTKVECDCKKIVKSKIIKSNGDTEVKDVDNNQ